MAGSFGSRVALLLWSAWLLAMASPTGTHDAGAPSAGGSGTTPSETAPDESAEPDSHEEAEEAPAETAPAETALAEHEGTEEEAPAAQEPPALPAQRLVANPAARERENGEPTLQSASTRGDFLRRLRASAENVERVRSSERTLARTENGVTVLSNVDQPPMAATAVPVVAEVADQPTRVQLPRPDPSVRSPADDAPAATPRGTRRQPAQDGGHWHWLWVLGGVATVLLVPIAMLLTRATRSG